MGDDGQGSARNHMTGQNTNGREYWRWAGLGFEFAGVVGLCFYLGYRADQRWQSEPWGLLAGGGVGLASGLYLLVKEAYAMMRQLDGADPETREEQHQTKDRRP